LRREKYYFLVLTQQFYTSLLQQQKGVDSVLNIDKRYGIISILVPKIDLAEWLPNQSHKPQQQQRLFQ
jgi:hypothetical protein